MIEIHIAREESYRLKLVQKRNNLLIFHSLTTDFMADLPNSYPPVAKDVPLVIGYVLIQDIHDSVTAGANSGA